MIRNLGPKRSEADFRGQRKGEAIQDLRRARRPHPVRKFGDLEMAKHSEVQSSTAGGAVLEDDVRKSLAHALENRPDRFDGPPERVLDKAIVSSISTVEDVGV